MLTMPSGYYNRFDEAKNYEEHLFIAGRPLQSAELNEVQRNVLTRLRNTGDAIFKDGDIIRDASVIVDQDTGEVRCQSGAVYLQGAVRGVPSGTLTVPLLGTVAIGVRLVDAVITSSEDPALKDPATGTRAYNEPGADRLKVTTSWGWSGDTQPGDFFPIYTVIDGVLSAKEPPPNLDALTQSLARYDRDSAGGSYVVSGLNVKALPDVGGNQVYSLGEGRARVYGYGVELQTSRRLTLAATPDLKQINDEPHLSTTASAQRINLDRTPATDITRVAITAQKTVSMVHGVFSGAQDLLPDTSVLSIVSVTQGATTYVQGTDYQLTAGKVDWSLAGAEPSPGSTYNVTYRHITIVTPTSVDDGGFTVTGAVTGTLVLVDYAQKLPRYDRLCISSSGEAIWFAGVASEVSPQLPAAPPDMLPLASVYQTWTDSRRVVNDGVRVVPMPVLSAIDGRLDLIVQLIAQQRLTSDIQTREAGVKKGLFTDNFLNDSSRDAGIPQTGAIVSGELVLPITATIGYVSTDIADVATCAYTSSVVLDQPLRTGSMNINPYMAFALLPARTFLTPSVDRWTQVETNWTGAVTQRMGSGRIGGIQDFAAEMSGSTFTTQTISVLVGSTTTNIETLRSISVQFRLEGFGPGEALSSIKFDGVSVTFAPTTANSGGVVTGSFTIPAGIPSGSKSVLFEGAGGSYGTAVFTGQGTLERQTWQQQTVQTMQSAPEPSGNIAGIQGGGPGNGISDFERMLLRQIDPLAQTFMLGTNTQVSGVDLWFTALPTTNVLVQIRETSNGFPTQRVVTQAVVPPSSIVTGGASTRIQFPAPTLILGGVEYALTILCNDAVGALSIAELGKFDATNQRWITSQPYNVGVLLSSANASTWTAHQDRDLTFRILKANFTETQRTISLGNVAVSDATDLLLLSYADRPSSQTSVDYVLSLPGGETLVVADGQPVQLASAITGNVAVSARLNGDANFAPVLTAGTQLVSGLVSDTGDYVSRATPAGPSSTIKVIFEANVPSGATLSVSYRGIDAGDTWTTVPLDTTSPADDGFVEFIHKITGVTESAIQTKVVLNGTPAARPRVRGLRVIVL